MEYLPLTSPFWQEVQTQSCPGPEKAKGQMNLHKEQILLLGLAHAPSGIVLGAEYVYGYGQRYQADTLILLILFQSHIYHRGKAEHKSVQKEKRAVSETNKVLKEKKNKTGYQYQKWDGVMK